LWFLFVLSGEKGKWAYFEAAGFQRLLYITGKKSCPESRQAALPKTVEFAEQ